MLVMGCACPTSCRVWLVYGGGGGLNIVFDYRSPYIYAIVAKRVRRLVLTYGWIYCSPNICLVVRNNYVACFSYMLILMGKIVRDGFLARV